jgi:proteic killer suppression protein
MSVATSREALRSSPFTFVAANRPFSHQSGQLHAAHDLRDLAAFPGNRVEALAGDRRGQHSIRVNDQYRICFVWHDGDADDVEIVDYH